MNINIGNTNNKLKSSLVSKCRQHLCAAKDTLSTRPTLSTNNTSLRFATKCCQHVQKSQKHTVPTQAIQAFGQCRHLTFTFAPLWLNGRQCSNLSYSCISDESFGLKLLVINKSNKRLCFMQDYTDTNLKISIRY